MVGWASLPVLVASGLALEMRAPSWLLAVFAASAAGVVYGLARYRR